MGQYEHHDIDPHPPHAHETLDQWNCFQCHKPISATRPPSFNPENCSCVEMGTHATGADEHFSQPMVREQPVYHYDATAQYHNQRPQSYASSTLSGPCPEGPEREDPNTMHMTNGYLPLAQGRGLNEKQHQHAASFHSNLSYSMQKYLGELDDFQPYGTEHIPTDNRFLSQDTYIPSSKKAQRGTKRSSLSMQSSNVDESLYSYGLDPVTAAGAWAGEVGNQRPGDGYAMVLSGLTEFHINENTN